MSSPSLTATTDVLPVVRRTKMLGDSARSSGSDHNRPQFQFTTRLAFGVTALIAVCSALIASRGVWLGSLFSVFIVGAAFTVSGLMTRRKPVTIVGLVIFFLSPIVVLYVFGAGHPVPLTKLARVTKGMSHEEVRGILGRPQWIDQYDRGDTWVYSGWTFCYIQIDFSTERKVTYMEHDH